MKKFGAVHGVTCVCGNPLPKRMQKDGLFASRFVLFPSCWPRPFRLAGLAFGRCFVVPVFGAGACKYVARHACGTRRPVSRLHGPAGVKLACRSLADQWSNLH